MVVKSFVQLVNINMLDLHKRKTMEDKKNNIVSIEKQTEIKGDLTPIAEASKTVMEFIPLTLEKLCSCLFNKLMMNNERHTALARAQLQKDVEAIFNGLKTYDNTTQSLTYNKEAQHDYVNAFIDQRNRSETNNVLGCVKTTAKILLEKNDFSDEKEFPETFFNHWRDAAKCVTEVELQEMWGRILAEEITAPQTISLKTIDTLRVMTKNDLEAFVFMCKYIVNDKELIYAKSFFKGEKIIPLSKLMNLGLCDYASSGFATSITLENVQQGIYKIRYGNYELLLSSPDRPMLTNTFSLTFTGEELYRLVKDSLTLENLEDYCNMLFTIAHTIIEIKLYKIDDGGKNNPTFIKTVQQEKRIYL